MFEQWVAMEDFFYSSMIIEIAIAVVFGIVAIATIFNLKNKRSRILFGISGLIVAVMAALIFTGLNKHQDFIDKTRFENAAVRRYTVAPFNKFRYSNTETSIYRVGYMVETFKDIGLYNAFPIEQEIEYLGSDNSFMYFQIASTTVYANPRYVEFTDEVDKAKRVGIQFSLIEPEFEELGFFLESNEFFEQYLVPKTLEDKVVDPKVADKAVYQHTEDTIAGWVVH
ncbi:hypothetical protein ACTQ45_02930 [Fundicoccus sp. Sow4_D5]|uniref:hypothetical protein n=1 Tax=Fundicoccus sp. Sow4_D5 TaxID=3438782 RepID=UPI003F8DE542